MTATSKPDTHEILWQTRPSIFLYTGTYVVSVVIFGVLIKIQYALSADPWGTVRYAPWDQPLSNWTLYDWPLFVLTLAYALMVFLVLFVILRVMKTFFTRYLLVDDQLVVRRFIGIGIVEYRTEMYRIVDFMQVQVITGGIFGFATITLRSTDAMMPTIRLEGVRKSHQVIQTLRSATEQCRQRKHIQEFVSPQMSPPPGRSTKWYR